MHHWPAAPAPSPRYSSLSHIAGSHASDPGGTLSSQRSPHRSHAPRQKLSCQSHFASHLPSAACWAHVYVGPGEMSEQYNALYTRSKSRHRVALNAGPSKQASRELMASVEASAIGGGEGDGDGDGGDGRGVIRIAGFFSPESELRGERGRVSERANKGERTIRRPSPNSAAPRPMYAPGRRCRRMEQRDRCYCCLEAHSLVSGVLR